MNSLEKMAGLKKANDNARIMADPDGSRQRLMGHLEGLVVTAVGDTTRNLMLACTHTDYSTEEIFLAVTRGTLRYAMGMIASLPDDQCRKVLEELAIMTDHIVNQKAGSCGR